MSCGHATENHILSRDYSAFSPDAWAALNPEGFAYCEDPTQSDSMLEWTLYSSSPDNVYFVDGYSCVNEREDRARIMEYFMVHEDGGRSADRVPGHTAEAPVHVRCRA